MSTPRFGEPICPRARNGRHRYDWAASDMNVLTSYARDADRVAVVRLSRCSACGAGLVAVATADSGDEDLGLLLGIDGLEVHP